MKKIDKELHELYIALTADTNLDWELDGDVIKNADGSAEEANDYSITYEDSAYEVSSTGYTMNFKTIDEVITYVAEI